MKRCPPCNRVESDDSLVFCRTDGMSLVSDSLSFSGEAGTARLGLNATEVETSLLPQGVTDPGRARSTGPTTVLPASETQSSTRELKNAESPRSHVASARNSLIAGAIGILLVIALGVGSYLKYGRSDKQIQSIAVMPFVNESGNADVEYLSDGMTETLISSLSQLPNLNVKPRSSVLRGNRQYLCSCPRA